MYLNLDLLLNELSLEEKITKKELIKRLKKIYLRNIKKFENIKAYHLYYFQKSQEYKNKTYKEKLTIISEKWKKDKKKYIEDEEWFNKTLEEYILFKN
jgi:hypothetical protein